ncbi:hypothetical protein HW115_05710 [Verrucomicrobiaceae bacterium N1E253]|uniref:Chondroitin sulfate ABC lyase n=1 Tax=Oceaniferula marina TaxID=2748318 RepID=A0A851GCD9_9BACT|nr:polysaccharide lyase family 8 super-sandwich domain-containing protein [Oceaniferula marina]NWK55096.1 hypothetical protein [Oceaniferula marina]
MSNIKIPTIVSLCLISIPALLPCNAAPPAEPKTSWPDVESFEGKSLPAYVTSEKSSIELSSEHIQDGKQSLKWTLQNGASLKFATGPLGNVNVYTGYGGYSRSSLTLPVKLTGLSKTAKLTVEFRAGDEAAGHYDIPFAHVGWQQLVHHYTWHTKIKWTKGNLRSKLDNIVIRASGIEGSTHAYFDAIRFNHPRDFRDARNPVLQAWAPKKPNFTGKPNPGPEELAKLQTLETFFTPRPNTGASAKHWQNEIKRINQRIEKESLGHGNPISKNLGHYFGFLNLIADRYATCPSPEYKNQFAKQFITINHWMQEQGLVVNGSCGKANNYVGRTYVDAVTKAREALAKDGSLQRSLAYIKWSYHYDDRFFRPGKKGEESDFGIGQVVSMDYLHNEARRMLQIALMHRDTTERFHHVNHFRTVLSNQITASIKPDGSLFHHGFHYFAYGTMGMNSISGTLLELSKAGLPVSRPALDAIKLGIMRMRWYSGGDTVMLALCGRHPSGTQRIPAEAFLKLAQAYAPYLEGKWDPEMVAAYLRFRPAKAVEKRFHGYQQESHPHGHVSMPYAGLGLHRRSHWLAGVKGFSQYVSAGESYANANRFGMYLSNGFLEIHSHPRPLPSVHGSGTLPDQGWNWCALDGTTSIHAPLSNIANGNGTRIERSGGSFNGGLSHDGRNGLFVLNLDSPMQAHRCREKGSKGGPFKARKSWFFFDQHIICLGTGIQTDQIQYPVRTTLFQKHLNGEHTTTIANAETITLGEKTNIRSFPKGHATFTDPYGNGYIVRNSDPIQLTVGQQQSRSGYDKVDTQGAYATAWIDHGPNPKNAQYEYVILPQTNEEELQTFAKQLKVSDPAPYQVLHQSQQAHVVYHRSSNTIGYAIFETPTTDQPEPWLSKGPLASVSQTCLVMIEENEQQVIVSLTDPNIRPKEKTPTNIRITLRGTLSRTTDEQASYSIVQNENDHTSITVPVLHGESHTLYLNKR